MIHSRGEKTEKRAALLSIYPSRFTDAARLRLFLLRPSPYPGFSSIRGRPFPAHPPRGPSQSSPVTRHGKTTLTCISALRRRANNAEECKKERNKERERESEEGRDLKFIREYAFSALRVLIRRCTDTHRAKCSYVHILCIKYIYNSCYALFARW